MDADGNKGAVPGLKLQQNVRLCCSFCFIDFALYFYFNLN